MPKSVTKKLYLPKTYSLFDLSQSKNNFISVLFGNFGNLTTAILKGFRVVIFACAIMDMSWVLCGLFRAPDFNSDYLNQIE